MSQKLLDQKKTRFKAGLSGKHVGDISVSRGPSSHRRPGARQTRGSALPFFFPSFSLPLPFLFLSFSLPFPSQQRRPSPWRPTAARGDRLRLGEPGEGGRAEGRRREEGDRQLRLPSASSSSSSSLSSPQPGGGGGRGLGGKARARCRGPLRHAGRLPAGAAGGAGPGPEGPVGGTGPPVRQHQLVPGGRRLRREAAAGAAAGQRGGRGDGERPEGKGLLRAGGGLGCRQPRASLVLRVIFSFRGSKSPWRGQPGCCQRVGWLILCKGLFWF